MENFFEKGTQSILQYTLCQLHTNTHARAYVHQIKKNRKGLCRNEDKNLATTSCYTIHPLKNKNSYQRNFSTKAIIQENICTIEQMATNDLTYRRYRRKYRETFSPF